MPFSVSPTMGGIPILDFSMAQDARYLSSPSQKPGFIGHAQSLSRLTTCGPTFTPHNTRIQKVPKTTRSRHNAPGLSAQQIQTPLLSTKTGRGASGGSEFEIQQTLPRSTLSNAPQTKAEQQRSELKKKSERRSYSPEPVDIESRILEFIRQTRNETNCDDKSARASKSEKNDALLKMMAELVNKGPESSDTRHCRSSKSPPNNDKICPFGCGFAVARECDLRKHIKRHDRPYGCTYPKCHKRFGAKSDWKRHENSQHFQQEAFRCGQELQTGQVCGMHLYREGAFKNHLEKQHQIARGAAQEHVTISRIGKNCQGSFWCGLCKRVVPLKERRNAAWDERFDHIAHHFEKEKRSIDEWVCAEENRPKKELLEEKKKRNFFDDEDEKDKDGDMDAAGDDDDNIPQPQPPTPAGNMPGMSMSSNAAMRPSPFAGDITPVAGQKRLRSEESAYNGPLPKRRQTTVVTYCVSLPFGVFV
jgi:hypothetical protein